MIKVCVSLFAFVSFVFAASDTGVTVDWGVKPVGQCTPFATLISTSAAVEKIRMDIQPSTVEFANKFQDSKGDIEGSLCVQCLSEFRLLIKFRNDTAQTLFVAAAQKIIDESNAKKMAAMSPKLRKFCSPLPPFSFLRIAQPLVTGVEIDDEKQENIKNILDLLTSMHADLEKDKIASFCGLFS